MTMIIIIIISIPAPLLYFLHPKWLVFISSYETAFVSRGILICKNDSHFCIHIRHQVKRQAMIILLLKLTIHSNLFVFCRKIEKTKVTSNLCYIAVAIDTDVSLMMWYQSMWWWCNNRKEGKIQNKKHSLLDARSQMTMMVVMKEGERERKHRNKRWDDREQEKEQNRKKKEAQEEVKDRYVIRGWKSSISLSDSGDPWFLPLFRSCFMFSLSLLVGDKSV